MNRDSLYEEPSPPALEDTLPSSAGWKDERIWEWARRRGGDEKTVRRNAEYVTTFFQVLEEFGFRVTPTTVTQAMVDRFKHDAIVPRTERNLRHRIAGRPMAPNHIANTLPRVRLFCEFVGVVDSEGHPLSSQTYYRRLWKLPSRPESVYATYLDNPGQLRDLLNATANDPPLQAMVVLTGPCDLRKTAAMGVTPQDLQLAVRAGERSTVRVIRGKFGKPQTQTIPPSVVGVLMNAVQGRDPRAPIWPYGSTELWRRLDRASKDARIPHTGPHTLRKSVASFASEAGCRPGFIQGRMNHASWDTTKRYYIRPSPTADAQDMELLDAKLREG
jgi:integrase